MLARLAKAADLAKSPPGTEWLYERKLDGLRCLAVRNGGSVELWSRNRLSFNARFPAIVQAIRALPADELVLDGEVVAFDGERTSFGRLQRPDAVTSPVYCAFDLLHLLGRDTTGLTLTARQGLLAQVLTGSSPNLSTLAGISGDATELLRKACAAGWEGLVAKRASSPYRSGRSSDWQKLKCTASQELVIGGWTDPSGTRTGFGAILVGYYDDGRSLRYAGKVGTGFDERTLLDLQRALRERAVDTSPFADPVPAKGTHWCRPELVAAIAFTEWTADGRLRHPSFQGLRADKEALEVRRETIP